MESFADHLAFLKKKSVELRIDILEMLYKAQSGYLGGSLSALDIIITIYYGLLSTRPVLYYDVQKPDWEDQDYFIFGKGHASPAWYSVLADVGFFDKSELASFRQIQSLLQAYPYKKIPGIALGAGSPGYGLAASVGLALALKMDKKSNHIYCLIGDGELQHGQIWEAAMAASHYKLDNITLFIDWNKLQMDGFIRAVMGIEPIVEKFQAFGWKTFPVHDGHDFEELLFALEKAVEVQRRPSVIIAHTVKSKGVPFAENKASYHAEILSTEEMAEALPILQASLLQFSIENKLQ